MPASGRRYELNAAKIRRGKSENVARANFASNANYVMDQFTL
jgi:hypothetical protein